MGEVKRMMWSCMCVRVVICRCEEDDGEWETSGTSGDNARRSPF